MYRGSVRLALTKTCCETLVLTSTRSALSIGMLAYSDRWNAGLAGHAHHSRYSPILDNLHLVSERSVHAVELCPKE